MFDPGKKDFLFKRLFLYMFISIETFIEEFKPVKTEKTKEFKNRVYKSILTANFSNFELAQP